jgi:amidase
MPYSQQEIFIKAQAKGSLKDQEYFDALARIRKATREDGLDKLVKENNLDVIITPSLGPAWSLDLINGGSYSGGYSSYSAISGYPYLTFPMGKVHHLPIGLSVIGLALEDAKIIEIAKQMEQVIDVDVSLK